MLDKRLREDFGNSKEDIERHFRMMDLMVFKAGLDIEGEAYNRNI
jgi:hypothetical protein